MKVGASNTLGSATKLQSDRQAESEAKDNLSNAKAGGDASAITAAQTVVDQASATTEKTLNEVVASAVEVVVTAAPAPQAELNVMKQMGNRWRLKQKRTHKYMCIYIYIYRRSNHMSCRLDRL